MRPAPAATTPGEQETLRQATTELARAVESFNNVRAPRGLPPYAMQDPYRFRTPQDPRWRPYSPLTAESLRAFARSYDVLAACLAHLKDQVLKTPFQVSPVDKEDTSEKTAQQRRDALAFFDMEGGLGGLEDTRLSFEGKWLDDLLVVGACAVLMEYTTVGSRADNNPDYVLAIDASTIRPLITAYGFSPDADAEVYEQWIQGVKVCGFTRDDLIYRGMPIFTQTHTPYPMSAVELLAAVIMTALKSDEWNRAWLTDGNVPDALITVPESWTLEQMQDFTEYFTALLSGNARERRKAQVVPAGTTMPQATRKDQDFQAYEAWLRDRTCSLMGVNPASIGHHGDTYKDSQDIASSSTRENRVAQLLLFRNVLYTEICRRKGWSGIHVTDRETDAEDAAEKARRHQMLIQAGLRTINECRQEDGVEPSRDAGADKLLIRGGMALLESLASPPGPPAPEPPASNGIPAGEPPTEPGRDNGAGKEVAPDREPEADGGEQPVESEKAESKEGESIERMLRQWERKCLNRLGRGQHPCCDFVSDGMDSDTAQMVVSRLADCETRGDVREAFAWVMRWNDGKYWRQDAGNTGRFGHLAGMTTKQREDHEKAMEKPLPSREATRGEMRPVDWKKDAPRLAKLGHGAKPMEGYTDYQIAVVPWEEGGPEVQLTSLPPHAKHPKATYAAFFNDENQERKFRRLEHLYRAIGRVDAILDKEAKGGGPREQEALVLKLIRESGFRNGTDDSGVGRGASTVMAHNARVIRHGKAVLFAFKGKGDHWQRAEISDPVLVAHVKKMKAKAGSSREQRLFDTTGRKVLDYLKRVLDDVAGSDVYMVHDLRRLHATMAAHEAMEQLDYDHNKTYTLKQLVDLRNQVWDAAAKAIDDTRTVAGTVYIHPAVTALLDTRIHPLEVAAQKEREEKRKQKAADLGLTIEQLNAQDAADTKKKAIARDEKKAADANITVEELYKIRAEANAARAAKNEKRREAREARREAHRQKKKDAREKAKVRK